MSRKETLFYDAEGNRTEPENAVRAEVVTYSDDGQKVRTEYFDADKKDGQDGVKPANRLPV